MSAAEAVLETRGVSIWRGGREVVSGVGFSLREGSCLSIIGPNGAGKTTLLLALLGTLPMREGEVRVGGTCLSGMNVRKRGRSLAYVPQSLPALPAFTVRDVVAAGRYPYQHPLQPMSPADREAVNEAIALCGLRELADRRIDAISGGERQKAFLAAAIAQDARVLLLDEPTTALDPGYQVELVGLLRNRLRKGHAVVLVSHDLQLPGALGGDALALRGGRVAARGTVAEIMLPDVLAAVYGVGFAVMTLAGGEQVVCPAWGDTGRG